MSDKNTDRNYNVNKLKDHKRRNSFNRLPIGGVYYHIDGRNKCVQEVDEHSPADDAFYNLANYCSDSRIMKQRALHEKLDRLLWRFACENGEFENEWDTCNDHFYIAKNMSEDEFEICSECNRKIGVVYFSEFEIAESALESIVKPFMKEYPDFEW